METVKATYTEFHERKAPEHVYPSEWVIRTLLGKYPTLFLDKTRYQGAKILDVGFGDGRNWPLLDNVGFRISGVEISQSIVDLGYERARRMGIGVDLRIGTNVALGFPDASFDYLLASNSCYYVDHGTTFRDNLTEYARVLKPGGLLLATLPEIHGTICEGCVELGDGHVEIRRDPWGLRNGYIFRCFRTEGEIRMAFAERFEHFSIGLCRDDYYGVKIHAWLLVCERKRNGNAP